HTRFSRDWSSDVCSSDLDPETPRKRANDAFVARQLQRYKTYFDRVESKPLTEAQRRACVEHEDRNLVLAGAGTGKTSTMVGKAEIGRASCRDRVEDTGER